MKYIGNFKEFVTPKLMNHLETHEGDYTPVWQPDRWQGHPLLDEYREMAWLVYSQIISRFHLFNA